MKPTPFTLMALARQELDHWQNRFTLELLADDPDGARLVELGKLVARAERRCLALERERA